MATSPNAGAFPPQPPVPSAEEIARAFLVSPRAAIEFFQSLGISVAGDWRGAAADAEQAAFYVSHVTQLDVLTAIKEEIQRALELGIPQSKYREFLRGRLQQLGWLSEDVAAPHRMDVIFRTNAQTAYNRGRFQTQRAYAHAAPYWQYIAVLDERTRPGHAEMSGKVFLASDDVWSIIYPPCGFNCRCRVRAMTAAAFADSGQALENGATFALPPGFPDPGFGTSPADPMSLLVALSQRAADASARAVLR